MGGFIPVSQLTIVPRNGLTMTRTASCTFRTTTPVKICQFALHSSGSPTSCLVSLLRSSHTESSTCTMSLATKLGDGCS